MTDKAQPTPHTDHVMTDVLARLRLMEQNLPPRVQTLEAAVSEIRKEFRDMRDEHAEQAAETRAALNAFNKTLQRSDQEHREEAKTVTDALSKMSRKITFASGAFWATGGLFTIGLAALYNWQKIAPLLTTIAQGVTP